MAKKQLPPEMLNVFKKTLLVSDTANRMWPTPATEIQRILKEQYGYELTYWKNTPDSWHGRLTKDGRLIGKYTSHIGNGDYLIACEAMVDVAIDTKEVGK